MRVELNDEVSQLLIAGTARPGETPTSSLIVATVMRICMELKKCCEVGR
jgi:hypothetical protein